MVIDALRAKGLYDECALFCFSDHGDYTGDHGLVEKTQSTFEDCLTRVPFVIKPPKGTPVQPRVSEALVELVDFSATVFAMTGIDPGYDQFGRDLSPVLAGVTDTHRDAVFCEGGRRRGERQAMELQSLARHGDQPKDCLYWPRVSLQQVEDPIVLHGKGVMCRTHDWKYVKRLYEDDELYDLRRDPGETENRIHDPACAAVLAALRERVLTWYQETCDVVPRIEDRR
jgi:arylsulfatase A-like enzyme